MRLECIASIRPVYAESQAETAGHMQWHKPRQGHYHKTTTTTTTEEPDYGSNANIPELYGVTPTAGNGSEAEGNG